jgi:hypothetical protein
LLWLKTANYDDANRLVEDSWKTIEMDSSDWSEQHWTYSFDGEDRWRQTIYTLTIVSAEFGDRQQVWTTTYRYGDCR